VSSHRENAWILDSGYSHHMTGFNSNFSSLEPYDGGAVTFGNNKRKSKIIGIGTIGVKNVTISNVYLVDGLNFNLLSISQLCDAGFYVKFDVDVCYLINAKTNEVVYKGSRIDDMYHLYLHHFKQGETCLSVSINHSWLWHRRLAHISVDTIKNVIKLEAVRGLPIKKMELDHLCDACVKGKQTKSSFKAKDMVSTSQPLQLIHIDFFGPINVPSLGKKRSVCIIVDDYSRYTWVIFLSQKSDTYVNFVEYYNRVENEKGLKINTIRSDHGGEFENAQFDDLCSKRGYRHEYSAPRTPQQNGVVERKNRTLQELAQTMLNESKLSTSLWAEAVNTACYVIN
jgi:GAG-pre-integrase domain/Integrase core domain